MTPSLFCLFFIVQIRNAVLLLVIELARANVQIQKILAFDNAFDKLLQIMQATEYEAVVEDCLNLVRTMLQGNESNQTCVVPSPMHAHLREQHRG